VSRVFSCERGAASDIPHSFREDAAANAQGGEVSVHDAPGGGALFRMRLAASARPEFVDAA
jgi:hypothetical protein